MSAIKKTVFHMFGAIGGGAMGFKDARVQVGNMHGEWECLGSVDVDAAANRDFARLVGTNATTLDLADLEQYIAIHDRLPPEGWREATPDDIRRAAGYRRPNAVFLSAPCKGFSGLLSHAKSLTGKYQALNRLTLRGVWLMLEAWADDPVEIILFENVPRLATRGRALLDRITAMLRAYGYAVSETTHDCGELGGLAQSRKRFLLVARHMGKVPNFLYEPPRRPLRAVGDVLGKMALPGDLRAGPMHRIPSLSWKTWVRLAFVEAGKDWRSLNRLAVEDGQLRDYLIVPELHGGAYGVHQWDDATGQDAAPGSLEQEAQAGLLQLFQAALEHGDNLLAEVEQMLGAHMAQLLNHKNQMLAKVARLNKRSGKVRTKGPGENLLQALIDKQIQQLDQQLAQIERGIAVNKRAAEMLAGYEQDEPPQPAPIIVDGFGFGTGTAGGSTRWWGR